MGNKQPISLFEPTKLKIRIWKSTSTNIGHVSLYLPDSYLYISFWPNGDVSGADAVRLVPSTFKTYQEDLIAEEKSEDETIEETIDMNVTAMEKCWSELKGNRSYSLVTFNCADAVKEVLAAGNSRFKDAFKTVSLFDHTCTVGNILSFGMLKIVKLHMSIRENPFFSYAVYKIQSFIKHDFYSSTSRFVKRN